MKLNLSQGCLHLNLGCSVLFWCIDTPTPNTYVYTRFLVYYFKNFGCIFYNFGCIFYNFGCITPIFSVLHLNARVYLLKMLSKFCNFFTSQYMIRIYNSKYIIFLNKLLRNFKKILKNESNDSYLGKILYLKIDKIAEKNNSMK